MLMKGVLLLPVSLAVAPIPSGRTWNFCFLNNHFPIPVQIVSLRRCIADITTYCPYIHGWKCFGRINIGISGRWPAGNPAPNSPTEVSVAIRKCWWYFSSWPQCLLFRSSSAMFTMTPAIPTDFCRCSTRSAFGLDFNRTRSGFSKCPPPPPPVFCISRCPRRRWVSRASRSRRRHVHSASLCS